MGIDEAHEHHDELLQLPPLGAPGVSHGRPGRLPGDLRGVPHIDEHMDCAQTFFVDQLRRLPSRYKAGHAHGQPG